MSNIVVSEGLQETLTIGQIIADSRMFADAHEQAKAIVKILAGQEMGFGAIASMTGIHVVKGGRVQIGANLMANAVKAHSKYDYRIRTMTNECVAIEFFENGETLGISEFTAQDARMAKTGNMDKFPRNMLFARAMSNGIKWFCPDALNGNTAYVPEELEQTPPQNNNGWVIEQPTANPTPTPTPQPKFPTREQLLTWVENLNQLEQVAGYYNDPKHVQNATRLEWPTLDNKEAWASLKQKAIEHADYGNYKNAVSSLEIDEDSKNAMLKLFDEDRNTAWETVLDMKV